MYKRQSLYGSAAANGVVLSTTKKGQTEKTTITVSNSTTFSKAYIMPDMQNRYGTSSGSVSYTHLDVYKRQSLYPFI